jgi:hypothetical protein
VNWLLLSFLGTVGVIIVVTCVVALLVRHRFHLRHRVHPKVPTAAPVTWAADPRAPARLHRRLAKVGHTAGAVADDHRIPAKKLRKPVEQPAMVELAEELRQQAVNLDAHLARTAMLPSGVRRRQLFELASSVSAAELACVRLVSVSAQVRTTPVLAVDSDQADRGDHGDRGGITDLAGQVERLAEAHRVLQQLDADAGLAPQVTYQSAR